MVTCGMQYFPPNKIWLIVLSTPLFSSYLYAAASEPVASLAPIVVQAEDEEDATENSKKYLCTRQISQNPYPIRILPS